MVGMPMPNRTIELLGESLHGGRSACRGKELLSVWMAMSNEELQDFDGADGIVRISDDRDWFAHAGHGRTGLEAELMGLVFVEEELAVF